MSPDVVLCPLGERGGQVISGFQPEPEVDTQMDGEMAGWVGR